MWSVISKNKFNKYDMKQVRAYFQLFSLPNLYAWNTAQAIDRAKEIQTTERVRSVLSFVNVVMRTLGVMDILDVLTAWYGPVADWKFNVRMQLALFILTGGRVYVEF